MVRVHLMPALRAFAGEQTSVDVEAGTIAQVFRALGQRYPELAAHLETGVAVAVDGVIIQDQLFAQLADGADVHIIPMIAGG